MTRLRFRGRAAIHDYLVSVAKSQLKELGFSSSAIGTEHDDNEYRQYAQMVNDPAMRAIRYRPDGIAFNPNSRQSFLFELKWAKEEYFNYSIEFESFEAIRDNWANQRMLYVFADVRIDFIEKIWSLIDPLKSCWYSSLDNPAIVYVPRVNDWETKKAELNHRNPNILFKDCDHTGGSGTPYFLIPKLSNSFQTLETSIYSFA